MSENRKISPSWWSYLIIMPFLLNNGLNLWGKIACWSLLAVEGLMQDWQTWYKAEFQERYFSESPWQLVSHSEVILQNNPTKQIIDFAQINKTYVLIPLLVVLLSCYLAQWLFNRHGLQKHQPYRKSVGRLCPLEEGLWNNHL